MTTITKVTNYNELTQAIAIAPRTSPLRAAFWH